MKKFIILCSVTLLMSGCGIFKTREVNKNKTSFSQASELRLKVDSTVQKTDKTIILETSKADSTITIPAKSVEKTTSYNWDGLIEGMKALDSNSVSVSVKLDTINKKITVRADVAPKDYHFNVDNRKETYTDKKENTTTNTDRQNKTSTEAKNKDTEIKTKPKGLFWFWASIVAAVIVIATLIYFLIKKKPLA